MPVLDPSGVQMTVKITEADSGAEYLMWTRSDPTVQREAISGADLAAAGDLTGLDLAIVEQVEIELNLGNNGRVNVTTAAPYDLGLRLLDSNLFKIGNVIEVQLGYPKLGRFTPWFSGMLAKPAIRMSPDDGFTATLTGQGGAFAALRSSSNQVYTGQTYRQIIEAVADRHRWTTSFPTQDPETPLDTQRESVSQGGYTDWGFIQQITRQANCDAYMAPDPDNLGRSQIVVRRRRDDNEQSPTRTFQMRGQVDFENVFPVLDFESDALGVWMPRAVTLTRSRNINPDDREVVVAEASPDTTETPALNETQAAGTGGAVVGDHQSQLAAEPRSDLDQGEYISVSVTDPSRTPQEVVNAHRDEAATRGAVTASVITFGIPEQFAGELVGLRGVGRLDGNYRVLGLTHRVQAGEWTMTLRLQNNATSTELVSSFFRIQPPSTNQEDPPAATTNDATGGGNEIVAEPAG